MQFTSDASSSSKNVAPSIELVKGFAFSDFSGRTDNVFLMKMDTLHRKQIAYIACLHC